MLIGFFATLRRSELAALIVDQIAEHDGGLVLTLPRSIVDVDPPVRSKSLSQQALPLTISDLRWTDPNRVHTRVVGCRGTY